MGFLLDCIILWHAFVVKSLVYYFVAMYQFTFLWATYYVELEEKRATC